MRECKSGNHPAACSKHRSQSSVTDSVQAVPLFSPLAGASRGWMNAGVEDADGDDEKLREKVVWMKDLGILKKIFKIPGNGET